MDIALREETLGELLPKQLQHWPFSPMGRTQRRTAAKGTFSFRGMCGLHMGYMNWLDEHLF